MDDGELAILFEITKIVNQCGCVGWCRDYHLATLAYMEGYVAKQMFEKSGRGVVAMEGMHQEKPIAIHSPLTQKQKYITNSTKGD